MNLKKMQQSAIAMLLSSLLLSNFGEIKLAYANESESNQVEETTEQTSEESTENAEESEVTESEEEESEPTDNDASKDEIEDDQNESESTDNDSPEEVDGNHEENSETTSSVPWEELEAFIHEQVEPDELNVLWQHEEPLQFGPEEAPLTVDYYGYYEVIGLPRTVEYLFDDQRDRGGIIIMHLTQENNTSEPTYLSLDLDLEVIGVDYISRDSLYLEPRIVGAAVENEYELAPGEKFEGYIVYTFGPETMSKIEEHGYVNLETISHYSEPDEFHPDFRVYQSELVSLPMSEGADETISAAGEFYPDKLTTDHMGTKTLIDGEEIDNLSQEVEGFEVFVSGYQITEFEPNENSKDMFANFPNGVAVVTVEAGVNNNSDENLQFRSTSASLILNQSIEARSEFMLEPDYSQDFLAPGKSAVHYFVYIMDLADFRDMYDGRELGLMVNIYDEDHAMINDFNELYLPFR